MNLMLATDVVAKVMFKENVEFDCFAPVRSVIADCKFAIFCLSSPISPLLPVNLAAATIDG
jgi:hypothetical protein